MHRVASHPTPNQPSAWDGKGRRQNHQSNGPGGGDPQTHFRYMARDCVLLHKLCDRHRVQVCGTRARSLAVLS